MGLLRPHRGPPDWHPANEALRNTARLADAYCQTHQLDMAEIATKFSLNQSVFDCTILGISSAAEIEQAVKWLHEALSTSPSLAVSPAALPADRKEDTMMKVAALNEATQHLLELFRPFQNYSWASPPPE
ncbi:hypothetical protein BJ085DRAFT_39784 [Dimargaris cristalligena]|uniref:NADP-dependent oxidoreductase domain-containing protein n=1 Tax=Dimargaris cristalligena TaxID=215637 RepID=A0A4P9ZTI0_9FUNG|nr:hypothetical protein BJ085DRAFT_39784 [Dimargaris cristalligena]|eukprot:RKP36823.1 hypothetical protein BJ085DRAFT_39784 [Dimargaris cristalligena]